VIILDLQLIVLKSKLVTVLTKLFLTKCVKFGKGCLLNFVHIPFLLLSRKHLKHISSIVLLFVF